MLRDLHINDTNSDEFIYEPCQRHAKKFYVAINVHVINVNCFGLLGKEMKRHATSDSLLGL